MTDENNWYQIWIEDQDGLPGGNLVNLVESLMKATNVKYIVIDDLDGALGETLNDYELPNVLDYEKFIKLVSPVVQFDWGYFYLFTSKSAAEKLAKKIKKIRKKTFKKNFDYVDIPDTGTTIRACDDAYFIIYTSNEEVKEAIEAKYPKEKIEKRELEEFKFYA